MSYFIEWRITEHLYNLYNFCLFSKPIFHYVQQTVLKSCQYNNIYITSRHLYGTEIYSEVI